MTDPAKIAEGLTEREAPEGFRPLSEFLADVDRKGVEEHGWLRWRIARLRGRLTIKWWRLRHPDHIFTVSPEAFDAVERAHLHREKPNG